MTERYSYKTFFQSVYQKTGQKYAFQAQTTEEAKEWKTRFRGVLWQTLGLEMLQELASGEFEKRDRKLIETAVTQEDGYCRYSFLMETLPDVFMPFYMLVPECVLPPGGEIVSADSAPSGEGNVPVAHSLISVEEHVLPAVIALPAHGANKDTVAGVQTNGELRRKYEEAPEGAYGLKLVRQGYVVFCPDPPGYGGRLEPIPLEERAFSPQKKQDPFGCSCKNLAVTAEALGFSLTALEIWDLMRLVDFVSERPEVDAGHIACVGFSGGGQYAMWLAALDERISVAGISGYVHGYYDSILDVHLCPCNYVPGLWRLGDISDICSLIAPRPLFIENGLDDPENGWRGIDGPREQVDKIRKAYRVYDRDENLIVATPLGGHRWHGGFYDFLKEMKW